MKLTLSYGPWKAVLVDTSTLGRGADNTISLRDSSISRKHCSLEPTPWGWRVTDLDSLNGVRVNDVRIDKSALIHDGDTLQVGFCRINVSVG